MTTLDVTAEIPTLPSLPSLSPSRAADFKTCPLLYRLRSIDRLPERPTRDQARGTLVHAVLEALFDVPPAERTPEAAAALVEPQWQRLLEASARPESREDLRTIFESDDPTLFDAAGTAAAGEAAGEAAGVGGQAAAFDPVEAFLSTARELLGGYFAVEDPRRLEPAEREAYVQAEVDGRLTIRGYIDRLDIAPDGALRVVDYKTGGAPREAFEARALFQLKFYALVLWRTRGVVPRVLRLLYLKDAEVCDFAPDADDLARFERTLLALWEAIERATAERDFRPKPSRLCGWCSYKSLCPEFGGTPPPFPEPSPTALTPPPADPLPDHHD
jgi:putative RecB family exonuclease